MPTRKRHLPVSSAQPGMVLGYRAVAPEHGVLRLSLPAGHVLTADTIEQLIKHRCEYVCIEEEDERSDEERAAEALRHELRLAHIFSPAHFSDPAIDGLFHAVLAYRRS